MKLVIMETPKTCGECLFYREVEYRSHSERGTQVVCLMKYYKDFDPRDKSFQNILYQGCKLKEGKTIKFGK